MIPLGQANETSGFLKIRISIIICTLNREAVFCQTLRRVVAIIRQREDVELIVVDQTRLHDEETECCLAELAEIVKLHRVEFASLTRARNFGIRHAKGSYVLFLDDDIDPSSNLIDGHLLHYNNSEVWGVGGCTLLPGMSKVSKAELSDRELSGLQAGRTNRFDLDWPRMMPWAPGCNMSFRREKLFEVGGFDEAFYGVAVGEEVELCWRLCQAGGIIAYGPDAVLVHLVNPSGGCRDAHKGAEMTAQFLDNQNYLMTRMGKNGITRWKALFSQCRIIALNRASLRDGTWIARLKWCWGGLRRAMQFSGRVPVRGLLGVSHRIAITVDV